MEKDTRTAKEVTSVGEIVHDVFDEGLRFIVMRGPASWCGYVGVPKEHPLAGFGYDDISFIEAHGGLTFASGGQKEWPEGYYWYGWDYAHAGDKTSFRNEWRGVLDSDDDKDWTVEEVIKDSWTTLYQFKQLMRFAEKIAAKKNLTP